MAEETKGLYLEIDSKLHYALKLHCLNTEQSIKEVITDMLYALLGDKRLI